ncbi:hypothetical protein POV26_08170 [Aequorivita todarodis]|uniref:hypothetical protein n=1 Tax=Aequorivita todarodis TaxID=2036821 RepID=UPI00234FC6CC|nr:hypothetical protein [Aequorivita todarodis]MDC8001010.1 hypothetical protein [Aequorivita todarodis]
MTRYLLLAIALLLATNAISQNTNLSDYSYVVVPEQFDFLNGRDQYQLNSMTKFYLEKNGFNAYMADSAPNANRCDGLFANVEKLSTILGTKLQLVLKDCNDNEVYRGQEGKSKYKEYDKSYQDALRKAFNGMQVLHVKQKDVVLLKDNNTITSNQTNKNPKEGVEPTTPRMSNGSGNLLPDAKFSNYSNSGKTYLLRKTAEGYSLYEESASAADGLLLKGKIIVMNNVVKYMDTFGNVADAAFDPSGNLIIKENGVSTVYKSED